MVSITGLITELGEDITGDMTEADITTVSANSTELGKNE